MSHPTWHELYNAALIEFDLAKLPERVEATCQAIHQHRVQKGHTLSAEERKELDDALRVLFTLMPGAPGSCLKAGREPGVPGTPLASARTGFGGHRSQAQAHTTLYVTDREQSTWQPETNLKSHRNSWFAAEHRS